MVEGGLRIMGEMEDLLRDTLFCFVDVETTGLHPQSGHRICEIALLHWRGGRDMEAFESLVNPGRPVSPGAYDFHGISDAMLRHAPSFGEIAPRVVAFLQDAVMVAHNAPFDLSFLYTQLAGLGFPMPANPVVDTLALARRCYCFPSNSLGNIARYLGIPLKGQHRARADVELTKEVFRLFLQDLERKGITSLGDLLEMQGGPVPLPTAETVVLPPLLEEALRGRRPLYLRYLSPRWQETSRVVDPIEVVAYQDRLYLVAFCRLRQEKRTFRLDRVLEMQLVP